jgi:hypothetical protein
MMGTGLDRRFVAVVLGALLTAAGLPVPSAAQGDGVAFPSTTSGDWEAIFDFSGFLSRDYKGANGFNVTLSDVIGDTTMSLAFHVDPEGRVNGTMVVNLEWFDESAGAASNGDPFHVLHDHQQTGTLILSGTADRLVAKGVLVHATNTVASGAEVEEVSGEVSRDVEWVFRLTRADCLNVTADLTEASGTSLVSSALLPRDLDTGSGTVYHHELVARISAWPATLAAPEAAAAAVEEVTQLADELKAREFPAASHLLDLIDAWFDLQAELAALNDCETAQVFWAPLLDHPWLVKILRGALETALESPDHYDAGELIDLWDVGKAEHVIDADLTIAFIDTFDDKLDEAIAGGDVATIETVRSWAADNGWTTMEEKASAALG